MRRVSRAADRQCQARGKQQRHHPTPKHVSQHPAACRSRAVVAAGTCARKYRIPHAKQMGSCTRMTYHGQMAGICWDSHRPETTASGHLMIHLQKVKTMMAPDRFRPRTRGRYLPTYLSIHNTTIEPLSDHVVPHPPPLPPFVSFALLSLSPPLQLCTTYTRISTPQHRPAPPIQAPSHRTIHPGNPSPSTPSYSSPSHPIPTSQATMQDAPHGIPTSQASPPLSQHHPSPPSAVFPGKEAISPSSPPEPPSPQFHPPTQP